MPETIPIEQDRATPSRAHVRDASISEQLFDDHFEAIYRFFSRRTSHEEDAQDLTGDTFAAVVERPCPRGVDPLCWLYGIARRKLADWLRKRRRTAALPPPREGSSEGSGELRKLIEALPEPQREALLLQVLEDLSVAQIAQVMGRSGGSVKALLQRAKERIRKDSRGVFDPEVQS